MSTAYNLISSEEITKTGSVEIVVVDQDPTVLGLFEEALRLEHAHVALFTDSVQGLQSIRTRRPQIVLLDLLMPDGDGTAVLEKILELAPAANIIATGLCSTESIVAAMQRGRWPQPNGRESSVAALHKRYSVRMEGVCSNGTCGCSRSGNQ